MDDCIVNSMLVNGPVFTRSKSFVKFTDKYVEVLTHKYEASFVLSNPLLQ